MGTKNNYKKTVDIVTKTIGGRSGVTSELFDIWNIKAEDLYALPFKEASDLVHRMDTEQKAVLAADVNHHLAALYAYVNKYGNDEVDYEDQPSVALFQSGMSKIKRWETVLYWLYEVDVMYDEAVLNDTIEEAKEIIRKDSGCSSAVITQLSNLEKKYNEKTHVTAQTDQIMSYAAQLCSKYFK